MSREFNGSTDRIDWGAIADLAGQATTVSAWVWLDTEWRNNYVLCNHDASDTNYGFVVNIINQALVSLVRRGSSNYWNWHHDDDYPMSTGGWHHILITSNGGTLSGSATLYLDGNTHSQTYVDALSTETSHTGSWSIGGRIYDDARNFDGKIAEVAVWDSVLDATKISNLASGYAPSFYATDLIFYWSGATTSLDDEVTETTGTADGTTYSASHPSMTYPSATGNPYYAYAQQ